MLSSLDVKNTTFSNAIRGYKTEEVEIFLDTVEADYIQFERIIKDFQEKIESLNKEIEEYKVSQNSIQNVLLNAQKLADQIVNEAKVKSEEIIVTAEQNITNITLQEKELANAFELKADERKQNLQKELDEMVKKAELKAKSITDAAEDSVKRQQVLFDKLKLEIAAFKSMITTKYKEHLGILQDIPDTVELDPQEMADIISAKVDELPAPEMFIEQNIPQSEPTAEQPVAEDVTAQDISSGFSVEQAIEEIDSE